MKQHEIYSPLDHWARPWTKQETRYKKVKTKFILTHPISCLLPDEALDDEDADEEEDDEEVEDEVDDDWLCIRFRWKVELSPVSNSDWTLLVSSSCILFSSSTFAFPFPCFPRDPPDWAFDPVLLEVSSWYLPEPVKWLLLDIELVSK